MSQPTNQTVGQNNNGLQNVGGPPQRVPRPRNATNLPTDTLAAIQQYTNLVRGGNPFTRTQEAQDVENQPPQSAQSTLQLISGL
ncbi:7109_t:CDS:1, partial [Gigaspora margarita]